MPVLGKAAVELFQYIITPPLDRRLTEWRNEIAEGLRRLEANRGLDFDALGSNPQFIDAVLSATLVATRTSQSGKLEALRNAVLNSALPIALDVTRQQVFLAMVDRFTDTHLAILRYFQGPEHWHAANQKPLPSLRLAVAADLLGEAFPELKPHKDLTDQLWSELHVAGLVNIATLYNRMEGEAVKKKRTTGLGDEFLAFITNPIVK